MISFLVSNGKELSSSYSEKSTLQSNLKVTP